MKSLLNYKNEVVYIDGKEPLAADKISATIQYYLPLEDKKEIIVLCIGSDRVTGDALGPVTGYKLKDIMSNQKVNILGCLDSPVHAKNLAQTIEMIKIQYRNPYIIAVDACLGRASHIGYITVGKGTLSPGAGVNKELPEVGDIFITGIVNISTPRGISVIQTTRLGVVMKMADVISQGIHRALQ